MKLFRFFAVFVLSLMVAVSAHASDPKLIGTHGDWSTFTFTEGGNKVCFMASQPTKSEGKYTSRGEVFALITHRPSEKSFDVTSFVAGYSYKKGSDVVVRVGSNKYTLFTHSDTAWAPDTAMDKALTKAIQNGSNMVVQGRSTRDTLTTDTYSLKGSTAAYKEISKLCGK